ncbi:hypothetical protein FRB98_008436 [Tulasnella sp. 332]|nr:hypothetical protein FRB98_008436 [Tulasnella sp. 332]
MRSPSVILITMIFIMNVADTFARISTAYRAFARYPDGPDVYYMLLILKKVDNGWFAVQDFCLSVAGFSADLLMCYRAYIIYNRDKRVLYFPCLVIPPATAGCMSLVMFDALAHKSTPEPGFPLQYYDVSVTMFVFTITMTWYSTTLICYRLWSMERQTRAANQVNAIGSSSSQPNGRLYQYLFRMMIQSGLLYSLTQLSFLICFITKNQPGQIVIGVLNIRITGIVTALIMLQLHLFDTGADASRANRQLGQTRRSFTNHSFPVFRAIDTTGMRTTTYTQGGSVIPDEKDIDAV